MDWQTLSTDEDIKTFMNNFGYFHDSCLKESHVQTKSFVGENYGMAIDPSTSVRLFFQRQAGPISAIEIIFEEIIHFCISPFPESYCAVILDSTFIKQNGIFYWANCEGFNPEILSLEEGLTWISAKNVKWRDRSNLMGGQLIYGEKN
ncbi:hypothetical protein ACQKM9_16930 [Viridibacillus sp. NPDC093762]|uniref:hypothetical protein n=1 Tax=Viridibacillus sp. NPDC093762 TaxID=3390720 RepID=UPI003D079C37